MENFDQEILGDKDYQEMAIKHAAIQGALDQDIVILKAKIKAQSEELDVIKTMCEEMKRERDCAEKKLKKVLEWGYDSMLKNNAGWEGLRRILTGEE